MEYQYFKEVDNALKASLEFKDFVQAFAFMTELAFWAEKLNHHPNWYNVYNKVEISLSTHDKGNVVTELDHKLAAIAEKIMQRFS